MATGRGPKTRGAKFRGVAARRGTLDVSGSATALVTGGIVCLYFVDFCFFLMSRAAGITILALSRGAGCLNGCR